MAWQWYGPPNIIMTNFFDPYNVNINTQRLESVSKNVLLTYFVSFELDERIHQSQNINQNKIEYKPLTLPSLVF